MKPDALDQRLNDLLLAADRSFPPRAATPIQMPELRARLALRTARRTGVAGIAAAIAIFAVLARPELTPSPDTARPALSDEFEIAILEREAESLRRSALSTLAERDQARALRTAEQAVRVPDVDVLTAAENAAFHLYCEADRLAKRQETADAAHERYNAVVERFPGTMWARMAVQRIPSTMPTEKG